ncbi:MAG: adenylate/guanylate cyclase domain-containing protein [Alphaproteobacteria bacterium]|nr:adenylate/guanylate cyclase domain-containing protein [Alphaproteobacteria bacterium]MCW5740682.1 adenylate/guanylate cyclase domain-containing protein [Alphaproteobacteria bacterium]
MDWRTRLLRLPPLALGIVAVLALAAARLVDPAPLRELRLAQFDAAQRLMPRPLADLPVRVVDIDDASLARIGQWPWPRDRLATLVTRLHEAGAAAIALDIVFAEPDRLSPARIVGELARRGGDPSLVEAMGRLPDNDALFAAAIGEAPVVLGMLLTAGRGAPVQPKASLAVIGPPLAGHVDRFGGALPPLPALRAAARGLGSISIGESDTAIVRQVPLLQTAGDTPVPGFAVEALRVALGETTIGVRVAPVGGGRDGVRALRIGQLVVPTAPDGHIWLHGVDPAADRARWLSAWRVLAGEQPDDRTRAELAALVKGRIVLVGASAAGLGDLRATAMAPYVPGVSIHAQAIEQMLAGWHLERPFWADGAELAALLAVGLLATWAAARLRAMRALLAAIALDAVLIGAAWWAFTGPRLLLDVTAPLLAAVVGFSLAALGRYVGVEVQQRRLRARFSQYLSPDVVRRLVRQPGLLRLDGEQRDMSFVFTDIAGFTSLTERVGPRRLIALLDRYLDTLCEIGVRHGGTIDKIVGDAVHVMFNAPLDQPDHADRALACAREMDVVAQAFARDMEQQGEIFGATRIGVSSGTAVVGDVGGRRRLDYTAHGTAVNLASRLEAANKALGTTICVSGATRERVEGEMLRPAARLMVRGHADPVDVFTTMPTGAPDSFAEAWSQAYIALATGEPEARAMLVALDASQPNDPLVTLHLKRLDAGARDAVIDLRG